jgi:hypothetical protein
MSYGNSLMPEAQMHPLGAQGALMTPDTLSKLGLRQSLPNLKQPVPRTQTGDRAVVSIRWRQGG